MEPVQRTNAYANEKSESGTQPMRPMRRGSTLDRMDQTAQKRMSLENTPDVQHYLSNARGVIAESLKTHYNDGSTVKYLKREELYANPLNEPYIKDIPEEKIEALKNVILAYGFKGSLEAIEDANGKYRIIAGGKRHKAILAMREEEYQSVFPTGIPVQVHPKTVGWTSNQELIHLLITNVFVLNSTPDRKQVRDLNDAFLREGYSNKEISDFLKQASKDKDEHSRTMGKIHAIDEFQKMCDEKKLGESSLALLGKSSVEDQKKIYQMMADANITNPSISLIGKYKKMVKENNTGQTAHYLNFRNAIDKSNKDIGKFEDLKLEDMKKTEVEAAVAEFGLLYGRVARYYEEAKKELEKRKNQPT